jgi:hypothetical protein
MAVGNKGRHLTTGANEYIKSYIEYDGSARMVAVYEARANAADGDPCLKTEYQYDGATTRIQKMHESEDEWDATWDVS